MVVAIVLSPGICPNPVLCGAFRGDQDAAPQSAALVDTRLQQLAGAVAEAKFKRITDTGMLFICAGWSGCSACGPRSGRCDFGVALYFAGSVYFQ